MQKRKVDDLAVNCVQRNVKIFLLTKDWPWWRLFIKLQPLLNVNRTEQELKLKMVRTIYGICKLI